MSRVHIPVELRRLIVQRARGRCEYCQIHQDDTPFTHAVDHIVATKHGGHTAADNLALACVDCNCNKGADLTTFDPGTGEITRLFNPRLQAWREHFSFEGVFIVGQTAVGRATVVLLRINDPMRIIEREALRAVGRYPLPESDPA